MRNQFMNNRFMCTWIWVLSFSLTLFQVTPSGWANQMQAVQQAPAPEVSVEDVTVSAPAVSVPVDSSVEESPLSPSSDNFQPVIDEQTARELMAAELNRILERNDFTVDSFEDVVIDGNAIRARIGDITYSANVEWHDRIAKVDPETGEFYETAGFLIEGEISLSTQIEEETSETTPEEAFEGLYADAQQAARDGINALYEELDQVKAKIADLNTDPALLDGLKTRRNEITQELKANAQGLRAMRVAYRDLDRQMGQAGTDEEKKQIVMQMINKALQIPAYPLTALPLPAFGMEEFINVSSPSQLSVISSPNNAGSIHQEGDVVKIQFGVPDFTYSGSGTLIYDNPLDLSSQTQLVLGLQGDINAYRLGRPVPVSLTVTDANGNKSRVELPGIT